MPKYVRWQPTKTRATSSPRVRPNTTSAPVCSQGIGAFILATDQRANRQGALTKQFHDRPAAGARPRQRE
jgi:hypothetical protein